MQQLIESKSLLAKLMATENLVVEQRKVQTASFDVKNRVLTIPQLDKDISGYLFDLFVGHEVGHALYTPIDGMLKAKELKIPMSIANLVEDSRIERKIKNKYPGIRNSFVKGYKELIEKDFFGTKGTDLNTLPFLDRMNMFEKGGASQGINFSEEERKILSLVQGTETYEDVIEVSLILTEYSRKEKELMKIKAQEAGLDQEDEEENEDDSFGEFESNGFDYDDDEDESNYEEIDSPASDAKETKPFDDDGEEDEKLSNGLEDNSFNNEQTTSNSDDVVSMTDSAFQQNQPKLFAADDSDYVYANIPTKMNLENIVKDYKLIYKTYHKGKQEWYSSYDEEHLNEQINSQRKQFVKFRNEANKVVSYLAKEFELRKNAEQLKRASVAKTGELNMNKIYSYQFNEDIFKKITVMPGGKSHGLVMFIDWSGSMHNHLHNTVKQLLSLVLFCKKVNIPYEVYAFSSEWETARPKPVEGDIAFANLCLLNLLSSRMSATEFTDAASILLDISSSKYAYRGRVFDMGSTPLNESIVAAMEIIPQFQKKYKLQIVNTVFLTDGEGHRMVYSYRKHPHDASRLTESLHEDASKGRFGNSTIRLVIRDPKTKHQVIQNELWDSSKNTAAYVELLKARTGCNVIGFYVLSGREFTRAAYKLLPRAANLDEMRIKFRKEKSMVITSAGFDEYYLLRSEGLDTEEDVEFEVKENATVRGLVSAFSKYSKNRLSSRVILNRFIGLVS